MKETLLHGLSSIGVQLTGEQADQLCRYGELLLEKNKVMNLTAIREPEKVATLHFLDCLALLPVVDFKNKDLVDVGCGAGFPGMPLLIGEPTLNLTMVDSLGKRMHWLEDEVLPDLGLTAACCAERAEEFALEHREQYDIATSRAVARLNILAELCLPLVKKGGCFLAMKGQSAAEELAEAEKGIAILGGKVERVYEYPIEDAMHRVIVIKKVKNTPREYPRQFAKIKKNPL